ncbi:MAG: MMPL family transporter [bacterium]|nr:MMPL family transporter [bacterium]
MRLGRRFTQASIACPWRALLIGATITAAAAPGLFQLELRTDGRTLVPVGAPEIETDREVRRAFDIRDPIAVVLQTDHPQGVFNTDTLRRVGALTEALSELDGVRPFDIASLATELGFRHRAGTLKLRRLLEPLPETATALNELRSDISRIQIYDGILVSSDSKSTAVLLGTPPEANRAELVSKIRRLAAATGAAPETGETVAVLGAPVAEALLGHHILADLGVPEGLLGARAWGDTRGSDAAVTRSFRPGMVPVAVAVMGLVFLLAFRRAVAALLPLIEIGICLVFLFGLMGWLGVPVYLTTSVLPVILAAVGAADEIHIFRRYLDLDPGSTRTDAAHRDLVGVALDEMAPPVINTSITTAVAFLAFAASPLAPVRAFGVFTAIGVLVCMIFSLTVIPALLVLLGPARLARTGRTKASVDPVAPAISAFERLAGFAVRRRLAVFAIAGVILVVTADGVRRLEVQDSWIDGFAADGGFARATRSFDREFLGSHLLRIGVEAEATEVEGKIPSEALDAFDVRLPISHDHPERLEGCWLGLFELPGEAGARANRRGELREWTTWIDRAVEANGQLRLTMPRTGGSARFWPRPAEGDEIGFELSCKPLVVPATLRRIAALESYVSGMSGVGGVLGPARYLETVGFMLRPEAEDSRRLPGTPRDALNRWRNYGAIRGSERLGQLVDTGFSQGLVTVYLEDANYRDTERILREVRSYEQEYLRPHGLRLSFAGDTVVSQALIGAVVTTQVRSLLLSLVGILIVAALLGRSLRHGLYCVVPPAFAVAVNFAVMGWLDIPLGVATSMFAGMTLGVGVDFAIHLLARHRRVASRTGANQGAIATALSVTGPAILIDALAVGLGFGVLVLSRVPANGRLGGLLMASVLGCFVATVFLVPALLTRRAVPAS